MNGVTLADEDSGDGPAVVFVHGLGGSIETPGGRSTGQPARPASAPSPTTSAARAEREARRPVLGGAVDRRPLLTFVDALGLDRVGLVGQLGRVHGGGERGRASSASVAGPSR